MHLKQLLIPSLALVLLGAGCGPEITPIPRVETPADIGINDIDGGVPPEQAYDLVGSLEDVTGGNAAGSAMAAFGENAYVLEVVMQGLPEPEGTDFYEGWIVRQSDKDVISTGRVSLAGETAINLFDSEDDLTDHDFYVLTLEPDDDDPAPAKHILEGQLHRVTE